MRLLLGSLSALILLGTPTHAGEPNSTMDYKNPQLIQRGAYLARIGACAGCHTAPGTAAFSGGVAVPVPLGTIYSSNITPDPQHGIGQYTYQDFSQAVRRGINKAGDSLYPVMPYPSFSRITETDMQALYAYFMYGVKASPQPKRTPDIIWPLSKRWPLKIWRKLFAPEPQPFNAALYADPVIARGAYLTEGLGHCGACHTPRGIGLQEKALSDVEGTTYLSGGIRLDESLPSNLRSDLRSGLARMSEKDIVDILKTGRSQQSATLARMSDIITHSTQHLTAEDLTAIARYLKSLSPHNPNELAYQYDDTQTRELTTGNLKKPGALSYLNNCAACHRSNGQGDAYVFPALAGNPLVQHKDPNQLIQTILTGSTIPATHRAPSQFTMPPFGWRLSDQEVATIANFIRTSWGNQATAVTASQVAKVRAKSPPETLRPALN